MATSCPVKQWTTIFLTFILSFGISVSSETLKLSNNGPAVLYSNLTITALLEGDPSVNYTYKLEYNDKILSTIYDGLNTTFVINLKPPNYKIQKYSMTVKVFKKVMFFIDDMVASSATDFAISEYIIGQINVSNVVGKSFVAVNSTLNITFDIYDPSGFFNKNKTDIAWDIGSKSAHYIGNPISYNVTDEGVLPIRANIHASVDLPGHSEKYWGFPERKLEALRRVSNINITGNVYLPKGDVVAIDINCDGSSPFKYCWRIFPPDVPSTTNLSCEPVTYSQCSFHFQHYFPLAGKYSVGTWVGNNLGLTQRTINIEIFDVSTRSQLSTIIVPISCSLIGMLIIIAGVTYHIHQRRAYVIEVADFDFHLPVGLCEKTFMERITESFKLAAADCRNNTGSVIDDNEEVVGTEEDFENNDNWQSKLLSRNYGSTA